jgi:hypothetical protein
VPVLADNEMVVHGDAERARDLDDRLRHLDVGARRGGIAGGMVVHRPAATSKTLMRLVFLDLIRSLEAASEGRYVGAGRENHAGSWAVTAGNRPQR